ncbi:MAG: peptidoglycan recognition family protein [Bacteroidota bacterium]
MSKAAWVILFAVGLIILIARRGNRRIRNISASLPRHLSRRFSNRSLSDIWEIVIHHTAGPEDETPASIAAYHSGPNHICDEGCPGISYHFLIDRSGRIYQTQPLTKVSYHTSGRNTNTVGVCLIGNYNHLELTPGIRDSLRYTIRHLNKKVGRELFVTAHRDHRSTSCPGHNIDLSTFTNLQAA